MAFQFHPSEEGADLGPPPGLFQFRSRPRWRLPGGVLRWALPLALLILLFIVASIVKGIYADWLWFESVDYQSVYRLRIVTRVWLFFAGADPAAVRRVGLIGAVAVALFLAVIFGAQAAGQWDRILLFMNSQPFGEEDTAFHKDIGFYVFRLPALNFILGWSLGLVILTTVVVGGLYAFRLLLGGFAGAPALARPHVSLLLVAAVGLFVWRYW